MPELTYNQNKHLFQTNMASNNNVNSTITVDDFLQTYDALKKTDPNATILEYKIKPGSEQHRALYCNLIYKPTGKVFMLKVGAIPLASGVKYPYEYDIETADKMPEYIRVNIRELLADEIREYMDPKMKDGNDSEVLINKYVDQSAKASRALSIIMAECKEHIVNGLKAEAAKDKRSILNKRMAAAVNRLTKSIPAYVPIQEVAKDRDSGADIQLERPMHRVRLPVSQKDGSGRIGYMLKDGTKFRHIVFDAKKMASNKSMQDVPVRVKVGGKLVDLDYKNVRTYITYMSRIIGVLSFDCSISTMGISFMSKFNSIYVKHCKPKAQVSNVITEDFLDEGTDHDDDDVSADDDSQCDVPKSKSKSKSKSKHHDEEEKYPEENSTDESDDDEFSDESDDEHTNSVTYNAGDENDSLSSDNESPPPPPSKNQSKKAAGGRKSSRQK